ncbi:unnamed protein product [Amoebophrya sp. A120]|nr:unnamed protein product [Amoebophrya sp. A120]|eukprot:GSA120T00006843001.1
MLAKHDDNDDDDDQIPVDPTPPVRRWRRRQPLQLWRKMQVLHDTFAQECARSCHAKSAKRQMVDVGFCITNEGEGKLCPVIHHSFTGRWLLRIQGKIYSFSGRKEILTPRSCRSRRKNQ